MAQINNRFGSFISTVQLFGYDANLKPPGPDNRILTYASRFLPSESEPLIPSHAKSPVSDEFRTAFNFNRQIRTHANQPTAGNQRRFRTSIKTLRKHFDLAANSSESLLISPVNCSSPRAVTHFANADSKRFQKFTKHSWLRHIDPLPGPPVVGQCWRGSDIQSDAQYERRDLLAVHLRRN